MLSSIFFTHLQGLISVALLIKIYSTEWKQSKNCHWITDQNKPLSEKWLDSGMDGDASGMFPRPGWAPLQWPQTFWWDGNVSHPLLFSASAARLLWLLKLSLGFWLSIVLSFRNYYLPTSGWAHILYVFCLVTMSPQREVRHSLDFWQLLLCDPSRA